MAMHMSTIKMIGVWLVLALWGITAPAGTVTYVYTGAQGTPLAEADASGNITARFEYTPYGMSVPSMGLAPNGPGYTGHVNDPDTGLVYMQARYYDPSVGRFLSVDPVGPSPGDGFTFNRYNYANDNPAKFTDPDGRCPQCLWGVPIGATVNLTVQMLAGHGSISEKWSNVSWKQVGVAAAAGGLSGGVSAVANTAVTTTGAVVVNVVGNAGVGALATQASAIVNGKTASIGEVLQGAALSGGAAGIGSVIEGTPGVMSRSAISSMTQAEKVAVGNLLGGIKEATPGFKYSNPVQTAANAIGAAVSASPDLKPLVDKKKDEP